VIPVCGQRNRTTAPGEGGSFFSRQVPSYLACGLPPGLFSVFLQFFRGAGAVIGLILINQLPNHGPVDIDAFRLEKGAFIQFNPSQVMASRIARVDSSVERS
jgi:hypothetical protein